MRAPDYTAERQIVPAVQGYHLTHANLRDAVLSWALAQGIDIEGSEANVYVRTDMDRSRNSEKSGVMLSLTEEIKG